MKDKPLLAARLVVAAPAVRARLLGRRSPSSRSRAGWRAQHTIIQRRPSHRSCSRRTLTGTRSAVVGSEVVAQAVAVKVWVEEEMAAAVRGVEARSAATAVWRRS